jgi:polyhydroxyalkanoate synthesis regulator phasin
MAGRGRPLRGIRELIDRLGLAALGVVVLTAERADQLADEISRRGTMDAAEARTLIDDVTLRWRGGAADLGERTGAGLTSIFRELGLVTRDDYEELELRIAQLEHRLRLVEDPPPLTPARRSTA